MIRQYVFLVSQADKQPIPNFWAYLLYAWMLEQVPPSYGEQLHIDRIDLEAGQLEVRGHIQELSYGEPLRSGSLWSRLFG